MAISWSLKPRYQITNLNLPNQTKPNWTSQQRFFLHVQYLWPFDFQGQELLCDVKEVVWLDERLCDFSYYWFGWSRQQLGLLCLGQCFMLIWNVHNNQFKARLVVKAYIRSREYRSRAVSELAASDEKNVTSIMIWLHHKKRYRPWL